MRRFVLFLSCIAALAVSCVQEEAPQEPRTSYAISGMNPTDEMEDPTKSVFVGDDGQITSITLFAFDSDGNIMIYGEEAGATYAGKRIEQYAESGGEIEWLLPISEEPYDIYAVANLGDFRGRFATVDELVFSPDMEWSSELLSSSSNIGIPMRSILEGVTGGEDYVLPMRRVVARFDLTLRNFDSGRLIWFDICNVNATVNVFGVNECADADDMADLHEYATEQDIEILNAGGTVSFYIPENMQTTAGNYSLTGNLNWKETAGKLVDTYGLSKASDAECTYIEIKFKRDSKDFPEAYFLYLGDGRNNFDVERGKKKNITANVGDIIIVDDDDVTKISISDGFHDAGEFYAASKVRADIQFSSAEAPAWSEGFTVQSKDVNGNDVISWDTPVKTGDNTYEVSGVCKKVAESASLEFINSNGRITDVMTVEVRKPGMHVLRSAPVIKGETKVNSYSAIQTNASINGTPNMGFIYLVDEAGYNLNQGYGVDASLLDISYQVISADGTCSIDGADVVLGNGSGTANTTLGSYVASVAHQILNDGTDSERNRLLSWMAGELNSRIIFAEASTGAEYNAVHSVVIPDIGISVQSHPYRSQAMSYKIDNKSNLPFIMDGITLFSEAMTRVGTDPVNSTAYGRLILPAGPDSWTSSNALFVLDKNEWTFSLESGIRNQYLYDGSYYIDELDVVYHKNSIEASRLEYDNYVRSFNHNGMYNILTASLLYPQSSFEDEHFIISSVLPKSSSEDEAVWGDSGMMDKGVTLYGSKGTATATVNSGAGADFSEFGSMVADNALSLIEAEPVTVYFSMVDNKIHVRSLEPVELHISASAKIYSHIRCLNYNDLYPGTQCVYIQDEHYFGTNDVIEATVSDAAVLGDFIDDAFAAIREKVYYSVSDGGDDWHLDSTYGTYREHLKPYQFELGLEVTSDRAISVIFDNFDYVTHDYTKSPAVKIDGKYRQPSADTSRHSNCDDCPSGDVFVEEFLYLSIEPNGGLVTNFNVPLFYIR